ncbi:serine/threonine-protein kinase [Mesoterricola sediminis]|uniref:Protein kinase domain-containing protein n=1 Tax=Mesoterricola sediminis TaxID=2927980 RepID=A0AA48H248_9BACT|nr:serine/threonine-protein kinase [Mesoterricola sediminis]BDU76081.1 hypothetical protein METESE_10390 [Mesoterricola sediminis]
MDFEDPVAVGRYAVLSRLGAGAMGAVYLCQDPLLKRKVAVKIVLKARSDSEIMNARFQRESEISAQLNHPNIITVFDVGVDPVVGPFLTMEFVDGCALSKRIADGGLDPATILDLLCQLGQALVAAERAGVVHRDIKPENVLVSKDGQIKLTDFGLARDDTSSLTNTGTMMGTPTHTAPELLGGDRATPITDRWAFCVLAFQMVLGRLPHPGETLSAVLNHIAHEPPAIPEGTPAPLARVFFKALHKDPSRRYESILAFLTALSEALGVRDKLVTRGLGPDAAASHPGAARTSRPDETEAFSLPGMARPMPASPVPAASPAAEAPVKGAARLTGPPKELLKGSPAPDRSPAPAARSTGPLEQPAGPPASPRAMRSTPRAWTPPRTPSDDSRGRFLIGGLAVAAAVAGFFLFPRTLVVHSTPGEAKVLVDGKDVGLTPYSGRTTFGTHMLEVRKDGYDTIVQEFRGGESPLVLSLQAATSWIDVVTDPPGAAVTLGGRPLGTSPCRGVPVPDHALPLVVTLRGHRRWEGVLGPGKRPPGTIRLARD